MSDLIKCVICGESFNVITWRHLRKHNLTLSEYKKIYPSAPIYSSSALENKKNSAKRANERRKGIPRSEETKKKISKTKKDKKIVAWNKGIPMSTEQKNKISNTKKLQYANGEILHWNIGNNTPDEVKNKISTTLKNKSNVFSEESKKKREQTIERKKAAGWVHHNTLAFNEKLKNSTNAEAIDLFNDREWLYTQHIKNKKSIAAICVLLGLHWRTQAKAVTNQLKKFNIPIHRWTDNVSVQQQEIEKFLDDLGIKYIANTRKIIPPYELDIYIPEYNLAIEYNGLFWHSEIYKDKNYHLMKTELCEEKGIRLIHIFEDEWRDQQQKCKDTLRHLLGKSPKGIYARQATIREISWKEAKEFLDRYHLLNAGNSGNYRIGAFDKNDNLIGVMVFGRLNNEGANNNIVELKRFVTNKYNNPGLGSKMFKYAVKEKGYDEVIAFVDRRWFTGLVKSHIGFEVIGKTQPSLWWTNGTDRYHRRFVSKSKLIEMGNDSSLSKREILISKNFIRIWDCGKLKLQWKSND